MNIDVYQVLPNIKQWVIDCKFKEGASLVMQQVKGEEELKEIVVGCLEQDMDEVCDGIGDSVVVLMAQTVITDLDERAVFMEPNYLDHGLVNASLHNFVFNCIIQHGTMAECIAKSKSKEELTFQARMYFQSLCHLAHALDVEIGYCADIAYHVIKDRKGEWINGSWVKEKDLNGTHPI